MIRIGPGVPGRRRCPPWLATTNQLTLGALLMLGLLAYGGHL